MFNKQTPKSADAQSADAPLADSKCLAYGQQVEELLSASTPDVWSDHLWAMYGGYVLAQRELGYSADAPNVFWSFRDLLFFFQELKGND